MNGPSLDATQGQLMTPVYTENLNSDVMVMESAEDGERFYASGPLNRRTAGASLSNDRCVLTEL